MYAKAEDARDVIVVGAGVMGSATAYALAARGRRVVLVEQFRVGHKRGSSHGASRIFRFSYPDERYVQMAMESLPLWRDLERQSGVALLHTTGGIDRGKPLEDHVDALTGRGASFEMLDGAAASALWPDLNLPRGEPALFQPDAGIVYADRAVQAFAEGALRAGAEILQGIRVHTIRPGSDRVDLETSGGELTAEVVVVTAGAWATPLLDTAGVTLDTKPTRETVAYFNFAGTVPTLVEWGEPSIYALPSPGHGIKVGEHIAGPHADPDQEGGPSSESIERLRRWVADRFPTAESRPHHAETCLYTNTPDQHFVLERHGRVVVGSPCSGHGFKFAPWIGNRLADLAREVR
jgi:monomeric sarcosine oxidase